MFAWWLNLQMLHFVPPIRLSLSVHFEMKTSTSIAKCKLIHRQGMYCSCCIFALIQKTPKAHTNKSHRTQLMRWRGRGGGVKYAIIIGHNCGKLRRFSISLYSKCTHASLQNSTNQHLHFVERTQTLLHDIAMMTVAKANYNNSKLPFQNRKNQIVMAQSIPHQQIDMKMDFLYFIIVSSN